MVGTIMVNVVNNSLGKSNVVYNVSNDSVVDIGGIPDNLEAMAGQVGLIDTARQLNQESMQEDQFLRDQAFDNHQAPPANDFDSNQNEMYQEPEYEPQGSQDYQEFSPETQNAPRKNKKKKNDGNKRFDTMAVNLAQRIKERDEALERSLYLEQELIREREAKLGITNSAYENQIDQITDLLIRSRREGLVDAEKQFTKQLSELQAQQSRVQEDQRILQQHVIHREQSSAKTGNDIVGTVFNQLFDKREFARIEAGAEETANWLDRNPACNPQHPDFDEEYADEVARIKKAFTKSYIRSGESGLIGEEEYYQELDQVLDHQFGRVGKNKMSQDPRMMPPQYQNQQQYGPQQQFAPAPQQMYQGGPVQQHPQQFAQPQQMQQGPQHGYQNQPQQYQQQQRQTNMPRMYTVPIGNNPPVSRVNRSGYNNAPMGYGAPQSLPQLDATHREIALRIPYQDAHGNTITDPAQRLRMYQQDLANDQNSGGNYGY